MAKPLPQRRPFISLSPILPIQQLIVDSAVRADPFTHQKFLRPFYVKIVPTQLSEQGDHP
jgi:hypothetical protein